MPTSSEIDQEVHKAHLLRTGAHSELQKSNFFFLTEGIWYSMAGSLDLVLR